MKNKLFEFILFRNRSYVRNWICRNWDSSSVRIDIETAWRPSDRHADVGHWENSVCQRKVVCFPIVRPKMRVLFLLAPLHHSPNCIRPVTNTEVRLKETLITNTLLRQSHWVICSDILLWLIFRQIITLFRKFIIFLTLEMPLNLYY